MAPTVMTPLLTPGPLGPEAVGLDVVEPPVVVVVGPAPFFPPGLFPPDGLAFARELVFACELVFGRELVFTTEPVWPLDVAPLLTACVGGVAPPLLGVDASELPVGEDVLPGEDV